MNNPELLRPVAPIDALGRLKFTEAARSLLPPVKPEIVDVSEIPGLSDEEPVVVMSAESEYEVDERLVQIRQDDAAGVYEVIVRITSKEFEPVSGTVIGKTGTYTVSPEIGASRYYETCNVSGTHSLIDEESSERHGPAEWSIDEVIAQRTLSEQLGMTVFTEDKLHTVLMILNRCGPHNQLSQ